MVVVVVGRKWGTSRRTPWHCQQRNSSSPWILVASMWVLAALGGSVERASCASHDSISGADSNVTDVVPLFFFLGYTSTMPVLCYRANQAIILS